MGCLPALLLGIEAWPEIVVPAYFVTRGSVLYDTIIFPHTPALILLTALLGRLFGFSPLLFRGIVAVAMGSAAALIVRGGGRRGAATALLVGVPAYIIWSAYGTAVTLWPDALIAPLALAGALALERFAWSGSLRAVITAGLLLGLCVLIKQTSAWFVIAGCLWMLTASRRRRDVPVFLAMAALPYALFAILWAAIYRTTSHLYWTLVVPLSGHAQEIAVGNKEMLRAAVPLFIIIPIYMVIRRRWREPLPWIACGAIGMAWPRFDLLHLSAALAIIALLTARSVRTAWRRMRRLPPSRTELPLVIASAVLAILLVTEVAAAIFFIHWRVGGSVYYWNDRATTFYTQQVRRHVPPGGAWFNYNTQYETLYAITGTTTPSGFYVNPRFWYYLNKRGVGERLCRDLSSRHGLPVLFTYLDARRDDPRIARTCLYRIVARDARPIEVINPATSWRVIP